MMSHDLVQRNAAFVLSLVVATGLGVTPVSMGGDKAPKAARLMRCNDFDDASTTWTAAAAGGRRPLTLRGLVPPVLLPDGTEFKTWEQPAEHRRTFFVAQNHPQASDENPGTEDRPWKTIGRAAAMLEPGDRVVVGEGMYREWVRPARGGTGPDRMITYQAAPGGKVVISGAQPYSGPWQPSTRADRPKNAPVWTADLPDALFDGYNPFAEVNMSVEAARQMPWATHLAGKHPYALPQGLVFQDGRRLAQTATCGELGESPGRYWVEPGGRRLHLRPFDDKDPGEAAFEVTTRPFAFAPEKPGLGFLRVDGFTVQHVANCFPMPQRGAISVRQGHHWIIENSSVRQVNALGLDIARRPVSRPLPEPEDTPELGGVGHVVRRNCFRDCGICSMQGLGVIAGLVEENFSSGCGWHRVEPLCETGGIKLHYNKHALLRRNVVHGTVDAPGIWVDHSNANTRVTANVVFGAKSRWGGMFLEASYKPNLVDHNVVWGCQGNGFFESDCDDLTVTNNLIGECTLSPFRMQASAGRVLDPNSGKMATALRNRIVGNVFYGFDRGPEMPQGDNVSGRLVPSQLEGRIGRNDGVAHVAGHGFQPPGFF